MLFNLLITIAIGAISGWIAGKIMDTKKGSLIRNILVGVIGGALGGYLGGLIGIGADGIIGRIVISVVGACLFIWIAKKLVK